MTMRDDLVKFSLPDKAVLVLDAMASLPRQLAGPAGLFQHVGTILFSEAGFLHAGNGRFRPDRRAAPPIGDVALRLLARFHPVTFTCVRSAPASGSASTATAMTRGMATSATPTPIPPIRTAHREEQPRGRLEHFEAGQSSRAQ
jgi:hypothetical protein